MARPSSILQCVMPARGTSSSSSALPNLLRSVNMVTETEQICPICHDVPRSNTYAMPCGHRFCLGCILRWVRRKPECAVCSRPVEKVCFRLSQAGTAPSRPAENSPHRPVASPAPSPQGTLSPDEQGTAGCRGQSGQEGKVVLPQVRWGPDRAIQGSGRAVTLPPPALVSAPHRG
uniref:RING-type domain-containing protein n=1 Tax=Bubo bubo TaxID=30461 RepID=A0A8C0EIG8_BUBBB